jgi:hypothetical protein
LGELDNNINWVCEISKDRYDNVGKQNLFSNELKEFLLYCKWNCKREKKIMLLALQEMRELE